MLQHQQLTKKKLLSRVFGQQEEKDSGSIKEVGV